MRIQQHARPVSLVIALAVAISVYYFRSNAVRRNALDGQLGNDGSTAANAKAYYDVLKKNYTFSKQEIANMRKKLSAKEFVTKDNQLLPHQFLHLHHMKTGGTSMDGLIRCARKRLAKSESLKIPYYSIHECGVAHYAQCVSGENQGCQDKVRSSAMMSYCAPLKDLPVFDWKPSSAGGGGDDASISALTVLRHPVARVWSMYRFQTKLCYSCRPLKDIYEEIDNGTTNLTGPWRMCKDQLMNHQTRNLLTRQNGGSDKQLVEQAIANMKEFFTMVGLTEELDTTSKMAGRVFPWLAQKVNGTSTQCPLPRKNASPSNNFCGAFLTHWDLPPYPDDETARLIEDHNQLDMQVYRAAVEHFNLQKQALGYA